MERIYDLIIIGAGPAGLSAGLYGSRAKMDTLILEKSKNGGQIVTTEEVANYPGAIPDASGPSLIARMVEQCKEFGAEIKKDEILEIDFDGDVKTLKSANELYKAKSVIIATGASPRKLGVDGEEELTGKGVSYCATCDGDFFTDLEVVVIGGGDTALEEGMFITKFARKVTIAYRKDQSKLRAAKSIQEKAMNNEKIEFMFNTKIREIKGDGILESVVFENTVTGEVWEKVADEEDGTFGVFVFVGYLPQTGLFKGVVEMDEAGYILGSENMETNIPGVFVAGDCRKKQLRQVVTATADGAIAAVIAEKYVDSKFD